MEGPQTVHLITVHISCSQTEFHLKRKWFTYLKKKHNLKCSALGFFFQGLYIYMSKKMYLGNQS